MMTNYIVEHCESALEKKYPGWEEIGTDRHFWILYKTDGEKPIEWIADDGGEPEDKTLLRDLGVMVKELNLLSAERDKYKNIIDKIKFVFLQHSQALSR